MATPRRNLSLLCLLCMARCAAATVIVTGAAGRTGSLVYKMLKQEGKLGEVRALVRNVTKAREVLGCKSCDASEGIFVGDITDPSTLDAAFNGVDSLAICTGVYGTEAESVVKAVEWVGVKNQVAALLKGGDAGKRVAMVSSMGSTTPPEPKSNNIMFYKLNAEAFITAAGVPYSIVKPCGLNEDKGGARELMAGHDDSEDWFSQGFYMIPRADVAAVTVASLTSAPANEMRFDLCAKSEGSTPTSPAQLLQAALQPWQRGSDL